MAPRKPNKKVTKPGKLPTRQQSPSASDEEKNDQGREYRSLKSREDLRDVMGAELNYSQSDGENDSYRSNTNQSRPNFSFLPSHKHSSPKRINAAAAHRLASMPTVPNTDDDESDATSTSTSNSVSSPRRSPRKAAGANSKTKDREQAQPNTAKKPHSRKQKTPKQMKLIKEIINLQGTVHNLIPKLSFARVIREILHEFSNCSLRVTPETLLCLQEATEIYLVQLFEDSYRCTLHRDRVTLMPKDMQLAHMLRRGNS